jgi:periplasmic protein TonB
MPTLSRLLIVTLLASAMPVLAEPKTEPPVPVRTVKPEYPLQQRRDGVSGVVTITCTVDEQGNVIDPEVVKSSHEAFEKPALEALMKWKFKPARQGGAAVAMKVSIPIRFVQEG